MSIVDAIKVCFKKYATASGRASRSEYWFFWLFSVLIQYLAGQLGQILYWSEGQNAAFLYLGQIVGLFIFVPMITVGIRRMHDTGHSGWYLLIPIYNLILCLTPGENDINPYGEPCSQDVQKPDPAPKKTARFHKKVMPRKPVAPQPAPKPAPKPDPKPDPAPKNNGRTGMDYFKNLVTTWFPNLTIEEDVPITQLTGDTYDIFKLYATRPQQAYKAEWGAPYTLVLSQDGKPRCIIMLLTDLSERPNNKVKYLVSKMFAQKLNIPYLYFYTNMENEELYCVKRIRDAMK